MVAVVAVVAGVDFEQNAQVVEEAVDMIVVVVESGQVVQEDLIAEVWRMPEA
jgi:hypothetical protein